MSPNTESESTLSGELQRSAVDVLDLSAKSASGVTVVAGSATWYSHSSIGLSIAVASFVITLILGWEKHKINKLITRELERKEAEDG